MQYAREGRKDGRADEWMFRLAMFAGAIGLLLGTFL